MELVRSVPRESGERWEAVLKTFWGASKWGRCMRRAELTIEATRRDDETGGWGEVRARG